MSAPEVRFVKRGKFRMAEPVPDHIQAAWGGLPVHGLPATTVRDLLHQMACTMVSMDYKRRHTPEMPISESCMPWMAHYAAQAKALLWAARDLDDDIPVSMPVLQPVTVSADDCRARFLELYADGELTRAIHPVLRAGSLTLSPDECTAMADAVYRLFEDLVHAGVVRDEQGGAT